MPQLDLDHLFCVGALGSGFVESMSKVACESETAATLPAGAGAVRLCGSGDADGASPGAADDAGAPAESVLLRVPDGVCLTHLFGAALRRDASTKGSSNPKAVAEAAAATRKGAPGAADSKRFLPATATAASSSKTAAAVVIGVLPASKVVVANKERRARAPGRAVVARAWRRPAAGGARVFASEAVVGLGPEPVSPKVSCFGAVLRERSSAAAAGPPAGTQEAEEEERSGCWASLGTALLGGLFADSIDREASEPDSKEATAPPEPQRQRVAVTTSPPRPVAAPPGLGDVKRLASRRWPETTMARGTV